MKQKGTAEMLMEEEEEEEEVCRRKMEIEKLCLLIEYL